MIDPKQLDEMARRFAETLPAGIRQLQSDVEKNVRAGLQGVFSKMDLVTREEFDVQSAVLARTRAKLEVMEQRLTELEARVLGEADASAEAGHDPDSRA